MEKLNLNEMRELNVVVNQLAGDKELLDLCYEISRHDLEIKIHNAGVDAINKLSLSNSKHIIEARAAMYINELIYAIKLFIEEGNDATFTSNNSRYPNAEKYRNNQNQDNVIAGEIDRFDLLLQLIKENTKCQEDARKEYLKLINDILDNNTFSEKTICNKKSSNVCRLNFVANKSRTEIYFSSNIIIRNDKLRQEGKENGLTDDEEISIAIKLDDINDTINYLININKIDDFIDYLVKKAIPLFLQDQHVPNYRIPDYRI